MHKLSEKGHYSGQAYKLLWLFAVNQMYNLNKLQMKKVLITLFVALMALHLSAQDNLLTKGEKVLNLSIGLGTGALYSAGTSSLPPVSASFEVGVKDDVLDVGSIGIGGYLGYTAYKVDYSWFGGNYGWKYSNLIIGARGLLHYPLVEKLDTYGGLMLGYNIVSAKEYGDFTNTWPNATSSYVIFSPFIGGRYYFSENFAALAELGYGIAYLNLGVALKF